MHPVTSGSADGRREETGAGLPAGRLPARLATRSPKPASFRLNLWGTWYPTLTVVVRATRASPCLGQLRLEVEEMRRVPGPSRLDL